MGAVAVAQPAGTVTLVFTEGCALRTSGETFLRRGIGKLTVEADE